MFGALFASLLLVRCLLHFVCALFGWLLGFVVFKSSNNANGSKQAFSQVLIIDPNPILSVAYSKVLWILFGSTRFISDLLFLEFLLKIGRRLKIHPLNFFARCSVL